MALRKTFKSCNATVFRPAKQAHKAVTIPHMSFRMLYNFLQTSVECYDLAIEEFTKRKNKFLRAAVTRDDKTFVEMLKQDHSLFSACYPVEDYSLRQFIIPAFVYYLFTWDSAGLEMMLNAIPGDKNNQAEALAVVSELLTQLESWKKNGVNYLRAGKQYLAQKYYDPAELCIGLTVYADNEEAMGQGEREDFVRNIIHPLQATMPVHLLHALAAERNNESGESINPVVVQVEKPLFGANANTEYLCFYPDNGAAEYALVMGKEFPVASKHPYSWSMAAVCSLVQGLYEEREQMVEFVRTKLQSFSRNPATMFADQHVPEPEQKKHKSLVCPSATGGYFE